MSLVGFTLLGSIEVPTISGTATGVPLLVKPNAEFTVAMKAALDVGGGDLRFSSDATGLTQLACEIVDGLDVVWVKPTGVSISSGATLYVWGDNTGASQPAVGAAFGRNAVWVDNLISSHLLESSGSVATSSTGTNDGLYLGSLPTLGADFGQNLTASNDKVGYGDIGSLAGGFTFQVKIKPTDVNKANQLFSSDSTAAGNNRRIQWRINGNSGDSNISAFIRTSLVTKLSTLTSRLARFTLTSVTPAVSCNAFSMGLWQEAQCIPSIFSMVE